MVVQRQAGTESKERKEKTTKVTCQESLVCAFVYVFVCVPVCLCACVPVCLCAWTDVHLAQTLIFVSLSVNPSLLDSCNADLSITLVSVPTGRSKEAQEKDYSTIVEDDVVLGRLHSGDVAIVGPLEFAPLCHPLSHSHCQWRHDDNKILQVHHLVSYVGQPPVASIEHLIAVHPRLWDRQGPDYVLGTEQKRGTGGSIIHPDRPDQVRPGTYTKRYAMGNERESERAGWCQEKEIQKRKK